MSEEATRGNSSDDRDPGSDSDSGSDSNSDSDDANTTASNTDSSSGIDGDIETDRGWFYVVGTVHLGLAGVGNIATGLALAVLGTTDTLVRWAFVDLDTYVSGQFLMRNGELLTTLATTGAILVGLVLVLVGAATLASFYRVVTDRRPTWWGPASVLSGLNPLVTPLAGVALVLLWIDRDLRTGGRLAGVVAVES